jgi:hypothetical protein
MAMPRDNSPSHRPIRNTGTRYIEILFPCNNQLLLVSDAIEVRGKSPFVQALLVAMAAFVGKGTIYFSFNFNEQKMCLCLCV